MSEEYYGLESPDPLFGDLGEGAPDEPLAQLSQEAFNRLSRAKRIMSTYYRHYNDKISDIKQMNSPSSSAYSSSELDPEVKAQKTIDLFGEVQCADLLGTFYYFIDPCADVIGADCNPAGERGGAVVGDDYMRPPPAVTLPDDGYNYYAAGDGTVAFGPLPIYESDPAALLNGHEELPEGQKVGIEHGLFWYRLTCTKHVVVRETANATGGKPYRRTRKGPQERVKTGRIVAAATRVLVRADACSNGHDQIYLRLRPETHWDPETGDIVLPQPWEPLPGDSLSTRSRWIAIRHASSGAALARELSPKESAAKSEALHLYESAVTAAQKLDIGRRRNEAVAEAAKKAAESVAALERRRAEAVKEEISVAQARQAKRWLMAGMKNGPPRRPSPPLSSLLLPPPTSQPTVPLPESATEVEKSSDDSYGISTFELPELVNFDMLNIDMPIEIPDFKIELPVWPWD